MAMSGSIHLTKVESLFITLKDSTRLRKTNKSASWDSTTLLLSTPETQMTHMFFEIIHLNMLFNYIALTGPFSIPTGFVLLLLASRSFLSDVSLSAVCFWWKVRRTFWSCSHITSMRARDTSIGNKSSQELRTHDILLCNVTTEVHFELHTKSSQAHYFRAVRSLHILTLQLQSISEAGEHKLV